MNTSDFTTKYIERFWSKVDIPDDPDSCWEWKAGKSKKGYGHIRIKGKLIDSHRAVWIITIGDIPDGQHVLHECDNPKCVNPKHLFLGTHAANMRDMKEKGRAKGAKGEENNNSKLIWSDVRTIRERFQNGEKALQLAKEYGVCDNTIYAIVRYKCWKE